jgi:putative SOS response-associated peptidase YedK
MCGRYALTRNAEVLVRLFGLRATPQSEPRYNIAPTQDALVVRVGKDGERKAEPLHWGLVPFWADDPSIGNRMINARAESAADKPAYRAAFRKRRCLVPADAFYEWKKLGKGKQPYAIRRNDDQPMALAGLWEYWQGKEGEELRSFTILTTDPNELVKPLHNRMPVVIDPKDFDLWLDPQVDDPKKLKPLIRPADASRMEAYPVSRRVNSPGNDDARCLEPVEPADEGEAGAKPNRSKRGDGGGDGRGDEEQPSLFS